MENHTLDMEVKCEISNNKTQCVTCLASERKLMPLGNYADIYRKIISETPESSECGIQESTLCREVKVCWECHMMLRKVVQFIHRAWRASQLLVWGQTDTSTLSSLTTVIFNDENPQTLYYVDTENIEEDNKAINIINKEEGNGIHFDGDDDNVGKGIDDDPQNVTRKIYMNKWAKERSIQNKKPKFKLLNCEQINIDDAFHEIEINTEEVLRFMHSAKASANFKLKRYKCEMCTVHFKNVKLQTEHHKKHHGKNLGPYICDLCQTRTPDKRHLVDHIKNHYFKYQCTFCDYVCYHRLERWRHMKKHRQLFECLKCGLKYGCRREFFQHYKNWHEKFICDLCGVSFKMRYCIKDHIRKRHSPPECAPCGKRFARPAGLWLHNRLRHPAAPARAAYCVECDARYPDVYRYRWHLANSARHNATKRRRIPCPGCDKVFSKNIYMRDHYDLVHLNHCKYRCEQCDKNFTRNAELVKHRRRVHEGLAPPRDKVCHLCGRGFTTNRILANHVRTHTGERPYACARCPAAFTQRTALRQHERALHAAAAVGLTPTAGATAHRVGE